MTDPTRRDLLRWAAGAGLGALAAGCTNLFSERYTNPPDDVRCVGEAAVAPTITGADGDQREAVYDYVIVGSGAGGGPLAARLAMAGYRVAVIEAGGDEEPWSYRIPAYHPLASEDPAMRWDFFVRHYADEARQAADPKYPCRADGVEHRGVYYPRAATIGGCTAHHALVTMVPHPSDWDGIAAVTGDASWRPDRMWRLWQRVERCQYVSRPDPDDPRDKDPGDHGFDGWLSTELPDRSLALGDPQVAILYLAARRAFVDRIRGRREGGHADPKVVVSMDPNDRRNVGREGLVLTPHGTERGRRAGVREYLRRVQSACPGHLTILTHSLATRVVFDAADERKAVGVEILEGAHLYRAQRGPLAADAASTTPLGALPTRVIRARREVILSGGAFNTPQLLMLSGIGPAEDLRRVGVTVRVDAPGVGRNLQDRYEVGLLYDMREPFALLRGSRFEEPRQGVRPKDRLLRQWLEGRGPYTTNGITVGTMLRSHPDKPDPDLFVFGALGRFEGYQLGYSQALAAMRGYFTWAILKAHTANVGGRVRLASADPRDPPDICFHSFDEGTDQQGEDLAAVEVGVEHVRQIARRTPKGFMREVSPGGAATNVRDWIRGSAWGHHASCSAKIGSDSDPMAVLDSDFRVRGVTGLRVVDASAFPRIPGFFVCAPTYVLAEKAAEVIVADARTRE